MATASQVKVEVVVEPTSLERLKELLEAISAAIARYEAAS